MVNSVAPLIKQSKIGPAVDMDVLLLLLVHEFMAGACPVSPLLAPRRITDGRLPAITNVGGAALARPSAAAAGALRICTAAPLMLGPRRTFWRMPQDAFLGTFSQHCSRVVCQTTTVLQ